MLLMFWMGVLGRYVHGLQLRSENLNSGKFFQ